MDNSWLTAGDPAGEVVPLLICFQFLAEPSCTPRALLTHYPHTSFARGIRPGFYGTTVAARTNEADVIPTSASFLLPISMSARVSNFPGPELPSAVCIPQQSSGSVFSSEYRDGASSGLEGGAG